MIDIEEELQKNIEEIDYELYLADIIHDEMIIEREYKKMQRKIINLNDTNMTFEEITKLENYIWKNDELIPAELLEGE